MSKKHVLLAIFSIEVVILVALLIAACAHADIFIPRNTGDGGQLEYRWINVQTHLGSEDNVKQILDVMQRAKNAGYNGVLLIDWQIGMIDMVPESYIDQFRLLKKTADDLGLEIYPVVISISAGNPILAHNPNLAEGLPVRDALFIVNGGQASLVPEPAVDISEGGFEDVSDNSYTGWDYQDGLGNVTFIDTLVKHSGKQSLRLEATGRNQVIKRMDVSPFRQYHLSLWLKTQDLKNVDGLFNNIIGIDQDGFERRLDCTNWKVNSTQDWTQYDFVFNSLNHSKIAIFLGTEDGQGGKVWLDDVEMEEIGLTNVIRRDAYPVVVKGEDGTVYEEGYDYEPIVDPRLGCVPYLGDYETYHESPPIRLTNHSRIKEGERLRVSFYHTVKTGIGLVTVSMTDPKAEILFREQIVNVSKIFEPSGYLLDYDEIIMGNWESRPVPQTQGQVIADSLRRNVKMVRSIDPDAKIFVWSDMFDPHHLAIDNLLLVNGTVDGSYDGLSKDITVVNWNYGPERNDSIEFFARRGNPQILAGYYDGECIPISQWLEESRSVADINGVMYTTWLNDYDGLEQFAIDAWGGK